MWFKKIDFFNYSLFRGVVLHVWACAKRAGFPA